MRIAVISAPAARGSGNEYAQALAKGMRAMGHHVDVIDAWTDDGFRLPGYEYIAVCARPLSFFSGKIPDVAAKVLAVGSGLVGKKSAAFIQKSGLFTARALTNLMKVMEAEGMMVNWSEELLNPPHAEVMGKRIGA